MRAWALAAVAAMIVTGAGCEKLFQKDSERTLDAGDKKAAAGDVRMAIKLYEAALDGTARTAEVHYKIALIYDDKLRETVSALHHFERYLQLAPQGVRANDVKERKKQASLRLAETLKSGGFMNQAEAARLSKENLDLRMLLVKLKAQKAAPAPASGTTAKGALVKKEIPAGARTYTVQKGDTLASIAAKFYKNKARWQQIRDANFESVKGTPPIRAGQVLMIP